MSGAVDEKQRLRALSARLTKIREEIRADLPFLGRLLLGLKTGFAPCGTAFTDMKRVAFDPDFAEKLSDPEVRFVYLHELMHCMLHHCTRGIGKNAGLYNIACDIVVNSMLLDLLSLSEFSVDGHSVMHLAPSGMEGRNYSAEEIYDMLKKADPNALSRMYGSGSMDSHGIWKRLQNGGRLEDEWKQRVREAASKSAGEGSGIPAGMERYLKDIVHNPTTNWRQLLHDHIQFDRSDYTYSTPDRRFSGDVFMPSFQDNVYGERLDGLWVLIDTSGSISDQGLAAAFAEIKSAVQQVNSFEGKLSFFDYSVSEPIGFESVDELMSIKPVGGGGTSFHAIFQYLSKYMAYELPKLILIITDGYAKFPDEEDAMGVDVIWVIIDSDVQPPWGSCVHVDL